MSWFNLWDGLKTKTCRYLLQRYLGQFFENNLNLEQLKVDLYNGKAVVENISLKVKALNDFFEDQGYAFEVISGHIGCLTAMVPWNALMTNDSTLNISNLTITLRPVTRCQNGTTMLESMWSSVSSSMQMAEECMKQTDDDIPFLNHNNTLIGLEKFAETIDNVLNRIHANLTNTTINIEYTLPKTAKRLIISFKAMHVEYKNQTGYGPHSCSHEETINNEVREESPNLSSLPMVAKHNLVTYDLTIYTSEIIDNENNMADLLNIEQLCQIVQFKGCQNFKISVKQTENIVGPKINLEVIIDEIYFMMTPRQIHLLIRIFKGFDEVRPKDKLVKQYSDIKAEMRNAHTKMSGIVEQDKEWCAKIDNYLKSDYSCNDDKNSNKCESVVSSTSTNSIATSISNGHLNLGSDEKSGEILKFKLQIFKIVGVFLHNDILFESSTNNIGYCCIYTTKSFGNYLEIASYFFQTTNMESAVGECYIPIPNNNYLLVMVSSLLAMGNQKRFCNELTLKTTLSATMFDFCEILDNTNNHLISFDRKKNCHDGYHTRPEIILSYISSCLFKQNYNISSNAIECTLDDCTADFDYSIYDRINTLFEASPFLEKDYTDIKISENGNPINMEIKCNSLKLNLRFPIATDTNVQLKKTIRKDYLLFDLRNILIELNSHICVNIDELDAYYCDDANENAIKVMQSSYKKTDSSTEKDKISLRIYNKDLTKVPLNNKQQTCKSPFTSKCSYGYTSHIEGFYDSSDKTDFFLPGDTDEINEFCENCKDLSNITVIASVPVIKIVLESKELYEIIYNRLNNDLLMWESQSATINKENMCCFELCVKEGSLIVYTDVQEMEMGCQLSSRGKLQLNLREFRLFSANSYNKDTNIGYFCVQLREIDVYHCGLTFEDITKAWNDEIDPNLMRIICNISSEKRVVNNRHEIISVVAEIKKQPDKRLKRIKLAFGVNGVSFWHKPAPSTHYWINQLMDFLNIADYPIDTFEPYALISELQGHIWNVAIEFRPKYLPYRALLDVGYCSLSSNIIYPMSGCTLRLISEDCIVSIGQTAKATNDVQEFITHISQYGLVPVLNVGLLNVSIHLNEKNKTYPNIDLRSSIHDIHLKTCFDGADVLAQLIAYIANDKDFKSSQSKTVNLKQSDNSPVRYASHNNDESLKHINKLMADAVKDVKTKSVSHYLNSSEEIKEETEPLKNKACSSKSRFNNSNISAVKSNEIFESYYNCEVIKDSLVQAELGATSSSNMPVLDENEFHVIHDVDIFFMDNFGVEHIYISEGPLQIVDNHFSLPNEKNDILRPPSHFPIPEQSYTLCEMTFTWHLFGGKDFPDMTTKTKATDNISLTTGIGMSETYKHGVSQAPSKYQQKNTKGLNDELNTSRNSNVLVEIQFTKIRFSYDAYPKDSIYSSRLMVIISDIEIRDRLLSSDINKLLYHPSKNNIPQRNDENIITVKALNVRSSLKKNRDEECSLKISILPIRLNIDQDTLLFLEDFFSALFKRSTSEDGNNLEFIMTNENVPLMNFNDTCNGLDDFKLNKVKHVDLNYSLNEKDSEAIQQSEECFQKESSPIYFKEFIFSPALPICFDYHGRRVELSRGPIAGLVMGLAQLQGSGICLREVINRRGILGWNKLFEFVSQEWLKDIKRNQLPNILSGIGPTNAVLQLFQGFFDLFRLPLQQYNKDGRIIRGFQLGAQSFSARTAFAALEITSRIIHLLQLTAETTFDMLSAGPSLKKRRKSKQDRKRHGRPKDLREGVVNAYTILKEGINDSANTLLEAAIEEHDQKGYSGAVGAVVRQLPQLVVCPAVLATQATTNILGGAKSSLVPEAKREATDKWKQAKN